MAEAPQRLRKPELFEALKYRPHPGQLLVHRSTASRRVVACGSRFGKTTIGVMEAVAAAMQPKDYSIGWIAGPDYGHSARIFERAAQVIEQHFTSRVRELSTREQKLVVVNFGGGRFELRGKSCDNPTSLVGEGLDYLIVDECARLKREVWEQALSQRLVDRRGWALLLSTPKGKSWLWRLFNRGRGGRDPAFESWQFPSWTNPYLDREAIEAERGRLPADVFAEEYEAQFVGPLEGRCDRCGAPDPMVPSIRIDEEPEGGYAECIDCGYSVDANGHTLVAWITDGKPNPIVRLVMQSRRDGSEPVKPMRCAPGQAEGRLVSSGGEGRVEFET